MAKQKEEEKVRGIFERPARSGVWWIVYYADGLRHQEKVGRKGDAIKLYQIRKADSLRGKRLPELQPSKVVRFGDLSAMAVEHAKTHLKTTHDTTFPGNHGMWRATVSPTLDLIFFVCVVAWEFLTMLLLWWGSFSLFRALSAPAASFNLAKRIPIAALTLAVLMWLVAFLTVGGEWFLMWQSHVWNRQDAAFRMFTVIAMVLVLLVHRDVDEQA